MERLKATSYSDKEIIRASEIGQYHYCSISWYLQKCGYQPKSQMLDIGRKKHKEIGKIINYTQLNYKKSKAIARIGYFLMFIGFLIFLFEVIV